MERLSAGDSPGLSGPTAEREARASAPGASPRGGLTQVVQKRRRGRGDPVHGERLNGVLRDRLTCLIRKTHALTQEVRMGNAAVALRLCAQNWMRPHRAVREPVKEPQNSHHYHTKTPATANGLTDHIWSWAEFLLFRPYQYQRE